MSSSDSSSGQQFSFGEAKAQFSSGPAPSFGSFVTPSQSSGTSAAQTASAFSFDQSGLASSFGGLSLGSAPVAKPGAPFVFDSAATPATATAPSAPASSAFSFSSFDSFKFDSDTKRETATAAGKPDAAALGKAIESGDVNAVEKWLKQKGADPNTNILHKHDPVKPLERATELLISADVEFSDAAVVVRLLLDAKATVPDSLRQSVVSHVRFIPDL